MQTLTGYPSFDGYRTNPPCGVSDLCSARRHRARSVDIRAADHGVARGCGDGRGQQAERGPEAALLVEMAGAVTPTPGAREQWGQRSSVTRIALLGESAVDRVHASFGPRMGGPGHPVPTQFFTSEATALEWLLES